jgi:hypothetical protein
VIGDGEKGQQSMRNDNKADECWSADEDALGTSRGAKKREDHGE